MAYSLELTFGGFLEAEEEGHPNEMKFKGVLVRLDEPSTKAPHGAEGHKILVPSEVAQKYLRTLIGMGLNYDPDLDTHAQRRKVGVIQKAWIKGKELWVSGIVWKHDFPEAQKDLKRKNLGMSMEISQVQIEDMEASVWKITGLCFLGATILFKDAAAYYHTQAIAAKAEDERRNHMAVATKKVAKKDVAATIDFGELADIAAKKAVSSVTKSQEEMLKVMNAQTGVLGQIAASLEELTFGGKKEAKADAGTIEQMETHDNKEGEASADDMESAKDEEDDECDDEMESTADIDSDVDKGDLEEMGPKIGGDDGDPGHLNDDVSNKGSKTVPEEKVGKTIASAQVGVLRKQVKALTQQLEASNLKFNKLQKQMERVGKQVTAAATETSRRSFPVELTNLLAKANVDGHEIAASGAKLSVSQFDAILASFEQATGVKLDHVKRMELKNLGYQQKLLEDGHVDRGYAPFTMGRQ